jgi:hypothetical protein
MKPILSYAGPEDFSLWEFLWPTQDLLIEPEYLAGSLEYHFRMQRSSDGDVESEVGKVNRLKFHATAGRYYSDGKRIYLTNKA